MQPLQIIDLVFHDDHRGRLTMLVSLAGSSLMNLLMGLTLSHILTGGWARDRLFQSPPGAGTGGRFFFYLSMSPD